MPKQQNKATRRAMLAAVMALAGLSAGTAGVARAYAPPEPVSLSVVDRDTGQVLRVWRHDGRMFVAGRPGARYALRVSNHTSGRVLIVLSVDGVNILSGETAGWDQRGYVFAPYQSYDLAGWRKSNTEIAAFTFAPLSRSYAARTGRPGDVGVIGMAVFTERVRPPPPPPRPYEGWREQPDADDRGRAYEGPVPAPPPPRAPSARAAPPADADAQSAMRGGLAERRDEKLGTGHGQREWSYVTTVDFERASSRPAYTRQIEYDTYAHLVAAGVIPTAPTYGDRRPRPFPGNPDGYVPDPPADPWEPGL